jgi:hypothetical protein
MYIKKIFGAIVLVVIMLSFTACSSEKDIADNDLENKENTSENMTLNEDKMQIDDQVEDIEVSTSEETNFDTEKKELNQMNIQVGEYSFTANLEDNSSVDALKEYLSDGPVTLSLEDYAGMEKVGDLGISIPSNDEQMNTSAGDIILYQGRSFVIYYGSNSWSLTRLGNIENISADELKEVLGSGDVDVTLSLK